MTLTAGVGVGRGLDGREAGAQATREALGRLGTAAPRLAILAASHQYQSRDLVSGVLGLLGDTPLIGFSTPAGLTDAGQHPGAAVVSLLAGEFEADAQWVPGYAQSGRDAGRLISTLVSSNRADRGILFFADGFNGDAEQFCEAVQPSESLIVGALSSGDLLTGTTFQMAGNQAGTGSLTAALLRGKIRIGVGRAHGWDPVGSQFRISRSRGFWLRTLNGRPASETYAELFGHPARDWSFPPLSYLARLYPLGLAYGEELLVRSPIRVEADGSFRMNAPLRDGADAYLLVGSQAACLRAATRAAQNAVLALGAAKPAFALILADVAWQLLLEANPGAEVAAVKDILGPGVPVSGGYTLGQIVPGAAQTGPPGGPWLQFLNQHILVLAFAEVGEA
jgi:hypothetical protein